MALSPCVSSLRASARFLMRTRPLAATTSRTILPSRALSTTPQLLKKRKPVLPDEKPSSSSSHHAASKRVTGGKQKNIDVRAQESSNSPLDPDAPDPLDFSPLLGALTPIDTHFKSQLQTLLHGGRFNPDTIGALPVHVDAETFPLRELAQVVPRGRTHISLLLNDAGYAKPIMSAVQSSPDFNQQPQKSEDNELELILRVEAERKDEVARRAKDVAQQWRDRVRQARSKHEKTMKDWKKKGLVLPDDLRKGERELQKLQDARMKDIDKEEAQVIRQLQR